MRKFILAAGSAALFLMLPGTHALCAPEEGDSGFTFAVVADPRGAQESWLGALAELRGYRRANPAPAFDPVSLVWVVGDFDPVNERYADFTRAFAGAGWKPLFLPVIGNHDAKDDGEHRGYVRDVIIPSLPGAVRRRPGSCDYYLDRGNARFISLDAYGDLGDGGVVNAAGREWAESAIASAPPSIGHVFLAFHEPAFPRYRHLWTSFNSSPRARDEFWNMLVRHHDKVRAVFTGHEHTYDRMRVREPGGEAANDSSQFPDEAGGIWQVGVGAVGHGPASTIVLVRVRGGELTCRALQGDEHGTGRFAPTEEWVMRAAPAAPGAARCAFRAASKISRASEAVR